MKVLLPAVEHDVKLTDRFKQEAVITGSLQHPGIPPVVEVGETQRGGPYFSMKLIEGETLAQLLATRRDPRENLGNFLAIFQGIAQTIAFAHSQRIIHRDLKPNNIMVGAVHIASKNAPSATSVHRIVQVSRYRGEVV